MNCAHLLALVAPSSGGGNSLTEEGSLRRALALAGAIAWEWDIASGNCTVSVGSTVLRSLKTDPSGGSLVHPEDRAWLEDSIGRAALGEIPYDFDFRILCPDGRIEWVRDRGELQMESDGRPVRWTGVAQLITEQKLAVTKLRSLAEDLRSLTERLEARVQREVAARKLTPSGRAFRQMLRAIGEGTSDAIYAKDSNGRYVYANPAELAIIGKSEDAVLGRTDAELNAGLERVGVVMANDQKILRTGLSEVIEEVFDASGQGTRTFRSAKSLLRDERGKITGIISISSDITELQTSRNNFRELALGAAQRTDELQRSHARLDYAVRLSGVGFWYCDLPFDELTWDNRVKEHFFFPPDARITIGDFYDRMHPEDREPTRLAIDRSISSHTSYDVIYRTVDPTTGQVKWIRASGGTAYAVDGTARRFDGVTIDVTSQKTNELQLAALNEALREQDRHKDEFLATLAHELRNPLAPIQNAATLLGMPKRGEDSDAWAKNIIQRQVAHMAGLLDDLLDVARITQGKIQLRTQRLPLKSIVDSAVEAVRPLLDTKGHELLVTLPTEVPLLEGDPLRLSQILCNLLTNAAKYTDRYGRIELFGQVQGSRLCISVKDNGIGIAPKDLNRVFTMFSQVETTGGRSDGGLGIGLALVKGLVALHHGSIEAKSEGLGHGSEFLLNLPLAAELPLSVAVPGSNDSPVTLPTRRILVADDNKDAAETLALILELSGHQVRVAHDGREALSVAQAFRPDVALLDIGMPELDGYEVARSLRSESWGEGIFMVALTGWGQDEDKVRSKAAGFDQHLTKPVDHVALESLFLDPIRENYSHSKR